MTLEQFKKEFALLINYGLKMWDNKSTCFEDLQEIQENDIFVIELFSPDWTNIDCECLYGSPNQYLYVYQIREIQEVIYKHFKNETKENLLKLCHTYCYMVGDYTNYYEIFTNYKKTYTIKWNDFDWNVGDIQKIIFQNIPNQYLPYITINKDCIKKDLEKDYSYSFFSDDYNIRLEPLE